MTKFVFKHGLYLWILALILLMLGARAAWQLPIQLLPDIRKPEIQLVNPWPAAAPQELETQLVAPLEELLAPIHGLTEIASQIDPGVAYTTLTFNPGTDMDQAYIDVTNRINQHRARPKAALEPQILNAATSNNLTVATLLLYATDKAQGYDRELLTRTYAEQIRSRLLQIPGIASLDVSFNPTDKRLEVVFDPIKLARFELTLDDVVSQLQGATDRPAGNLDIGARTYAVRYHGRQSREQLGELLVAKRHGRNIYLNEIATLNSRYENSDGYAYIQGKRAFYIAVTQNNHANSIELIDAIKQVTADLNTHELAQRGLHISLGRDESVNVLRAIDQVQTNLVLGMLLATAVMLLFIRRPVYIGLIFFTVPVAVLMTLAVMQLTGRTLNVISLAGIALSTGLILDAAIVAIENILRLRQNGLDSDQAIIRGLREVRGALITSVISSIVVFVPLLMLQTQESQLFEDIALTITASLVSSLVISLTLLPLACRQVFRFSKGEDITRPFLPRLAGLVSGAIGGRLRQGLTLLMLLALPLPLSYWLMPASDVLPDAKDRAITTYLGYTERFNFDAINQEVIQPLTALLEEHMASGESPQIDKYFMATSLGGGIMGIYPKNDDELGSLATFLQEELYPRLEMVDTYTQVSSLLSFTLPSSRKVLLDIQGKDLPTLMTVAQQALGDIADKLPDAAVQPTGPLGLSQPQLKISPRDQQLALLDSNRRVLGDYVEALNEGLYIDEYFDGSQSYPLFIKGPVVSDVNTLLDTPLFFPGHGLAPLRLVAEGNYELGPEHLTRINSNLTVTLEIFPPEGQALGAFLADFKQQVEPGLVSALGDKGFISYRGSANRLEQLLSSIGQQFAFAALVLLLLMIALFRSLRDGLVVMLTMPIALLGGVLALRALNLVSFQSLDVITMIGFIILIGLVINNAILFISQYHDSRRQGLEQHEALRQTLEIRARPIYMSTLTSIFGMLPLLLIPGTGAEIYRGLAAVIAGGMVFSALFTLPLMSALLYRQRGTSATVAPSNAVARA